MIVIFTFIAGRFMTALSLVIQPEEALAKQGLSLLHFDKEVQYTSCDKRGNIG